MALGTVEAQLFPLICVLATRPDWLTDFQNQDYTSLVKMGFSQGVLQEVQRTLTSAAVLAAFNTIYQAYTYAAKYDVGYDPNDCPTCQTVTGLMNYLGTAQIADAASLVSPALRALLKPVKPE